MIRQALFFFVNMSGMKIISWNVNGIRACVKKGFMDFLKDEAPDYLCIQESKIQEKDLEDHIEHPPGYRGSWVSAEKKRI